MKIETRQENLRKLKERGLPIQKCRECDRLITLFNRTGLCVKCYNYNYYHKGDDKN